MFLTRLLAALWRRHVDRKSHDSAGLLTGLRVAEFPVVVNSGLPTPKPTGLPECIACGAKFTPRRDKVVCLHCARGNDPALRKLIITSKAERKPGAVLPWRKER